MVVSRAASHSCAVSGVRRDACDVYADHREELLSCKSALQKERSEWQPQLPRALQGPVHPVQDQSATPLGSSEEGVILQKLFPETSGQTYVRLETSSEEQCGAWSCHPPLRVGVVLSGGQAPGGHNVIAGLFDYVKQCNPNSQLFGFLGGPHGIFTSNYREIDAELMHQYRNQGGFDMICSGRHKIETDEQKAATLLVCKKLALHGLVVVGGDDSNTNAAILAEYFKANKTETCVIGCPKTIDGDLRNAYVETSFGFDTAVKTYAELIGNLCTDIATSQNRYHFVRLMGRSASNITLECALQTRPNLCFIGEEVQRDQRTLHSLVDELVDLVLRRAQEKKYYGVVLLPEGLIEFIPEVGALIRELNDVLAHGLFDASALTEESRRVFDALPPTIRNELLLDRDPHGNVQVARIATEKLLMLMVHTELEKRGHFNLLRTTGHYFGYEGRCALPSLFDATYCYALGHTAGALLDAGLTGYMAVVQQLHRPVNEWTAAGCPLQWMMTLERRHGREVPVIKKYLVDLNHPVYHRFSAVREQWKVTDYYRNPGPIQFSGPCSTIVNYTLVPPTDEELLPPLPFNAEALKCRYKVLKSESALSPLQKLRLATPIEVAPLLRSASACAVPGPRCPLYDQQGQKFVNRAFPLQTQQHHMRIYNVVGSTVGQRGVSPFGEKPTVVQKPRPQRIGVVLQGQQAPGSSNVLHGLFERLRIISNSANSQRNHDDGSSQDLSLWGAATLIGFKGITGLLEQDYIEISKEDLTLYFNQGGFELLGRTKETKARMRQPEGLQQVLNTCQALKLDGLVMIGGQTSLTDAALVAEYLLEHQCSTCVVGVPATQENNLRHNLIEASIGFDSTSKCYASLVGNLLTDAASARKYWYFVRLMGQVPSHSVLEAAFQTHPNVAVIGEQYAERDQSLFDVVNDIADVVCKRADEGKNFGTVLIPEGLVSQLPNLRQLFTELDDLVRTTPDADFATLQYDLVHGLDVDNAGESDVQASKRQSTSSAACYRSRLTPWALALLKTLPSFFREQLIQQSQLELAEISVEQLVSHMVDLELQRRKSENRYSGSFTPVCHYLGFQGRSTLPSDFDCHLGLAHGYLACVAVEAQLTGYVTSIRGLCGPPGTWKMSVIPITALMKVMPEKEMRCYGRNIPMVPCAEVDLQGKPYTAFRNVQEQWETEDHFCNPGPIQFSGPAAHHQNRTLFEEQHAYLEMLGQLDTLTTYIQDVCTFGVDENALSTTVLSLEGLTKILRYLQASQDA